LAPNDIPIAATARPISSGARLALGGWFRRSTSANTNMTRNAVPTIWSMSGPVMLAWKYGAGKVAKMLKVGVESAAPPSVLLVMCLAASKLEIALWYTR
jgi:hypothetical protein